jgi:release factor glutamine methyltransferase
VLLSNPPYVPKKDIGGLQRELRHEPSLALFAGEDGFDAYRQLVPGAARIVKPGGWLLLELGYNGREGIEQLLDTPKWRPPTFQQDLAGIDRVVSVRRRT